MIPPLPEPPPTAPAPGLTEDGRRRLRAWRAIVKGSLAIAWICLALVGVLLFVSRAPRPLRVWTGIVLVEPFLTAARGAAPSESARPAARRSGWRAAASVPAAAESAASR